MKENIAENFPIRSPPPKALAKARADKNLARLRLDTDSSFTTLTVDIIGTASRGKSLLKNLAPRIANPTTTKR